LGGLFQERRNIVAQESRPNQIDTLQDLALELRRFADERDWEVYHTPKNLASALIVEAAELLEHFQWLSQEESRNLTPATREAVAHEIADVLIYLTRLADQLGIDMLAAAADKMALNARKYPASLLE
jgi:dCTP diphosphatase